MNNDIDQMHFLVLHVGEAHCVADWNYKHVCSPFTRIYYVTRGHARIELPDCLHDLRPGHMYIIPAFTLHSYECHEEFDHYYVHIYNESEYNVLEDFDLPTEIEADERMLGYIQRLCHLCPGMELQQYEPRSYDNTPALSRCTLQNKRRGLAERIESRAIIYLLLAAFIREASPHPHTKDERVVKVLDYLRTHLTDKLSLEQLADLSCMSGDHLIRLFRREMHTTPFGYLHQKRMERAQLRLATENVTVGEVACQLGFDDPAYFSRVFKAATGLTPVAYRKRFRQSCL